MTPPENSNIYVPLKEVIEQRIEDLKERHADRVNNMEKHYAEVLRLKDEAVRIALNAQKDAQTQSNRMVGITIAILTAALAVIGLLMRH